MTDDYLERVQARAYEIWEREGRPDGAAEAHWQQASAEILQELTPPEKAVRKPRAPKAATPAKTRAPKAVSESKPKRRATSPKEEVVSAD